MDDEHVLALVEAVDGTYLYAVHVLTFDTAFIDDVGHHLLRVVGTPQAGGAQYACLKINGLFQSCVIAIDHGASGSTALCFQQIAVVNSFTMSAIAVLVRWLKMDAEETRVL